MKTLIYTIFGLLFCIHLSAQNTANYWIESTDLDSLVIISNGEYKTVKGFKNNTYFNIERNGEQPVYLKPYCDKKGCRDSISIKLWGAKEDAYTHWIYLQSADSISLDVCFRDYLDESFLSRTYRTAKEKMLVFWKSISGGGRVISGQKTVLRGGETPLADEPKLAFKESDNFRYPYLSDFELSFEVASNYPIKNIYIVSHERELIFCGGDCSFVQEIFPHLKKEQVAPLAKFVKSQPIKGINFKKYLLDIKDMQAYFLTDIQLGKKYQLGVELANDTTDFNPYLFNFEFFTLEELKLMETFASGKE